MDSLNGRTAVITGAASGIGLELAHRFGREGMNLVLADVEAPALDTASAALSDAGYPVESMVVDVRELEAIQALEALARERFTNVHVLCNNAGVGGGGSVADLDNLELWKWVIDIDLWGVIYGCKAFLPAMIEHGEPCHVVNTASMAGLGSTPGMGAYSVAKYGVVALSETLSMEMSQDAPQVGVSVLCPAFVRTAIADSGRNLPDDLKTQVEERMANASPEQAAMSDFISALVEGGISTEIVADAVHDAVMNNNFWILTHDDSRPHVLGRAKSIVEGINPKIGFASNN